MSPPHLLLIRSLASSRKSHHSYSILQVTGIRCKSTVTGDVNNSNHSSIEVKSELDSQHREENHHHDTTHKLSSLNKDEIRNELLQYWMMNESKSLSGRSRSARYCCYTYYDAKREYESSKSKWYWLDQEMSSNLAGETGAVYIYKGALQAINILNRYTNNNEEKKQRLLSAQNFCETHHATEESHRIFFDAVMPDGKRTRLLPLWRIAGYSLGLWPTLIGGTKALYVTVEAVEDFVEDHFQEQIAPLRKEQSCPELLKLLEACCADEVHHKEDAARQLLGDDAKGKSPLNSWWIKPWSKIVRIGSSAAAEIARRV